MDFSEFINEKIVASHAHHAWSAQVRTHRDLAYAKYYNNYQSIEEAVTEDLKEELIFNQNRIKSLLKAYSSMRIDFLDREVFKLIPDFFMEDYARIISKISKQVIKNKDQPKNYEFLKEADLFLHLLSKRKVKIEVPATTPKDIREYFNSFKPYINYNLFGTRTGRLTNEKGSLPILTLRKENRKFIKPTNDYFAELDFNACELRTLLGLNGIEQPQEDLHEWNNQNIFFGSLNRDEAKEKIFSWLYDEKINKFADMYYNKDGIKQKYWDGLKVKNHFDREISCDSEHYAVNYIVQSTAMDLFFRQVLKINELLSETNSFIAFMVHDSVVLDLKKEDIQVLKKMIKSFSETEFGNFMVNVSIGTDFGNMRKAK